MIAISIDVTLLDKAKFKTVVRKNGKTAIFADLCLIETPNGTYGDYMCVQSVTEEERLAGIRGAILGNGKIIGSKKATAPTEAAPPAEEDDVPFN